MRRWLLLGALWLLALDARAAQLILNEYNAVSASSYLNGVNLNIDRGTGAARLTDQADPGLIWGAPQE